MGTAHHHHGAKLKGWGYDKNSIGVTALSQLSISDFAQLRCTDAYLEVRDHVVEIFKNLVNVHTLYLHVH